MSKSKEAVIEAYQQGFRVSVTGDVISPVGTTISPLLKDFGGVVYRRFNIRNSSGKTRSVLYHHLAAYQKYRGAYLVTGVLVRHKNGNSQDNSPENILLGSHSDNRMDIPKDRRRAMAIHAASTNRRFDDATVHKIRQDKLSGMTYKELCQKYQTSKSTLSYLFTRASY